MFKKIFLVFLLSIVSTQTIISMEMQNEDQNPDNFSFDTQQMEYDSKKERMLEEYSEFMRNKNETEQFSNSYAERDANSIKRNKSNNIKDQDIIKSFIRTLSISPKDIAGDLNEEVNLFIETLNSSSFNPQQSHSLLLIGEPWYWQKFNGSNHCSKNRKNILSNKFLRAHYKISRIWCRNFEKYF